MLVQGAEASAICMFHDRSGSGMFESSLSPQQDKSNAMDEDDGDEDALEAMLFGSAAAQQEAADTDAVVHNTQQHRYDRTSSHPHHHRMCVSASKVVLVISWSDGSLELHTVPEQQRVFRCAAFTSGPELLQNLSEPKQQQQQGERELTRTVSQISFNTVWNADNALPFLTVNIRSLMLIDIRSFSLFYAE